MWLLALDTSGRQASVALMRAGELVVVVPTPAGSQHSVELFRTVEQVLAEAGIGLADIDVFVAANGPGSFTGLRVGLAAVKGFAEAHGKPAVAIGVLEAFCELAQATGLLVPVLDAYRGQIFGGLYEKTPPDITARQPDQVATLEEFLAGLAGHVLRPDQATVVTPQPARLAAGLAGSPLALAPVEPVSSLLAGAVARRAWQRAARGETIDALRLEAHYVRRSDAELLWQPK